MKTIPKRLTLLVSALALFAMIACTTPAAPEPEAAPPSSTPETMALRTPAMEPPPLDDFNEQRQSIDEAWNLVHDGFDQWRADLTMCHPATMTEALNEFAIEFNSVTEAARGLTRTNTTGEFADKLITAAEAEETAFRQLRDRWQPGNVSLFENVEIQRNLASQAQREAKDHPSRCEPRWRGRPILKKSTSSLTPLQRLSKPWRTPTRTTPSSATAPTAWKPPKSTASCKS